MARTAENGGGYGGYGPIPVWGTCASCRFQPLLGRFVENERDLAGPDALVLPGDMLDEFGILLEPRLHPLRPGVFLLQFKGGSLQRVPLGPQQPIGLDPRLEHGD